MPYKHENKMQQDALLYAYGELPQEREAMFLKHLKDCKECQRIVQTSSLINAALPQLKAPEYLPIPDLSAFKRKKSSLFSFLGFNFRFRLLAPLGAAAVMLVMALGTYQVANIYSQRRTQASMQYIDNMYDSVYTLEDEVYNLADYIDSL